MDVDRLIEFLSNTLSWFLYIAPKVQGLLFFACGFVAGYGIACVHYKTELKDLEIKFRYLEETFKAISAKAKGELN